MTRLWLVLFFLLGVGFCAVWIADHPGQVVIHWFDYRIDTSVAFLGLLGILAGWLLVYAYALVHGAWSMPKRFSEQRKLKHFQSGLKELTYSVAALAASDLTTAEKHAAKAHKYLGQTPMGLLVSAQIAKSRGEDAYARTLLDAMMEHKETKQIATRLISGATEEPPSSKVYVWGQKFRSFIRKAG